MNAYKGMIAAGKGDYRNRKSAIKEGKAIQADALRANQSTSRDLAAVKKYLTEKFEREMAARQPK